MYVASYVGAWIETFGAPLCIHVLLVAPYVGAWIETQQVYFRGNTAWVAPYVGAWIETVVPLDINDVFSSRTLRGCVD